MTLKGECVAEEFKALVEAYVQARYAGSPQGGTSPAAAGERRRIGIKAVS